MAACISGDISCCDMAVLCFVGCSLFRRWSQGGRAVAVLRKECGIKSIAVAINTTATGELIFPQSGGWPQERPTWTNREYRLTS